MKLVCLVALLVCAIAQGTNLDNEILPPAQSVEYRFEDTHLELKLQKSNNPEAVDDQLPISKIEALEKQNGRNIVTDAIMNMLEGFRDIIINGSGDIPPLDPYVIPTIGPIKHVTLSYSGEARINNFRMEGLRWFLVDDIKFNPIRLAFGLQVTVPWITVTGSYDARARLGLLTHRAGGNFRIFAHRIEIGADMRLGVKIFGGQLFLRELNIVIDIHDTQFQISGMTGSTLINSFISDFIQNVSQELIQNEMENVSKIISEVLFDIINDVLEEFSIDDILGN